MRTYPNGATAMRELAAARGGRPIGCTQVTEILNTPGVQLVAPLPEGFELATVYTAGVCTRAASPQQARELAALLAGDAARAARQRAGFVCLQPRGERRRTTAQCPQSALRLGSGRGWNT